MLNLSIVIPAYNERLRLQKTLPALIPWAARHFDNYEIIVVNDGSIDDTHITAYEYGCRVIENDHYGKAYAVMTGITYAWFDYILVMDADMPVRLNTTLPLIADLINNQSDVVYGSRGLNRPGAPMWRKSMAMGMVYARNIILPGMNIVDTQCGVKAMKSWVAHQVVSNLAVYSYRSFANGDHVPGVQAGWDVEFAYVCNRLGYKIREMPVDWKHQKTNRVGLADGIKAFQDLILIRAAESSGLYSHPVLA